LIAADESAPVASRTAQEFPLEIVFVERDGRRERHLTGVPVVIRDAQGRYVFGGRSSGPLFLSRLRKGRYTVTRQCDAWSFLRPVTIDTERGRVVYEAPRHGFRDAAIGII
jgi:hypothetical protein